MFPLRLFPSTAVAATETWRARGPQSCGATFLKASASSSRKGSLSTMYSTTTRRTLTPAKTWRTAPKHGACSSGACCHGHGRHPNRVASSMGNVFDCPQTDVGIYFSMQMHMENRQLVGVDLTQAQSISPTRVMLINYSLSVVVGVLDV